MKPKVKEQPGKFDLQDTVSELPKIGRRNFSIQESQVSMPLSTIPRIDFELDQRDYDTGRWRSKAVLNALEGVKRNEIFENLRIANNSSTIAKKIAILNASPNVALKNKSPIRGALSQRLPSLNQAS